MFLTSYNESIIIQVYLLRTIIHIALFLQNNTIKNNIMRVLFGYTRQKSGDVGPTVVKAARN